MFWYQADAVYNAIDQDSHTIPTPDLRFINFLLPFMQFTVFPCDFIDHLYSKCNLIVTPSHVVV